MFDIQECKLMILDPIDLLVDYINKSLNSNKIIKIIFS